MNLIKRNILKKILCSCISMGILISTIPVAYSNAQISLRYMFQPNGYSGLGLNNSLYVVTADDLSNIENIIIPEVYDDGENGSSMVAFGSLSQYDTGNINYSVKSVKINTTLCRYSSVSGSDRPFRYLGALEKIEFAYSGKDFMLVEDLFRFTTPNKADSETLKEVHINAESVILNNPDVFRNRDSAITAKIYVKNENVKNTILNETAKGDYAVNADQVIIKTVVTDKFAALNEALEKAIIYKQSNYTMSSYEILSNAVLSGSELKKNLEASEE